MSADEMRELLEWEPFEPMRIRLSSGDAYEVRNLGLAVMMRSRLFPAFPGTDRPDRLEPRRRKRRPKPYSLLQQPRAYYHLHGDLHARYLHAILVQCQGHFFL